MAKAQGTIKGKISSPYKSAGELLGAMEKASPLILIDEASKVPWPTWEDTAAKHKIIEHFDCSKTRRARRIKAQEERKARRNKEAGL